MHGNVCKWMRASEKITCQIQLSNYLASNTLCAEFLENRFPLGCRTNSGTLCTRVSTISRMHKKGSQYSHETNAPECSSSLVHSPRRKETVVIPVSRIRERRRARSAFTRRALRVISLVRAGLCWSASE